MQQDMKSLYSRAPKGKPRKTGYVVIDGKKVSTNKLGKGRY